MRRALLALVLLAPFAGCFAAMDRVFDATPVVLVEHVYAFEGTGTAQVWTGPPCELARREGDRITLFREPGLDLEFVLLQDVGTSWRAVNATAPAEHTLRVSSLTEGGGALSWFSRSHSFFGFGSVFPSAPREDRTVRWQGGEAYLGETRLEAGVPVERSWEYAVPVEEGGTLRVKETARVTYLGRVGVTEAPLDCPQLRG